ncbi:putative lipid II flippase FtsW [Paenarthrobacter ilicis]|uniref:Probable peptidoglycan glycosyltransferase FtsW n=1 Tax=Paenarthrobacter ilicis TaxID=43665 RepID=A0ABX0TP99_9MICC|nr:putative lipid II flippase FtsW [Paenarthrobacter ilicis]MBM7792912.1 cell division protein FtsW [Paenarthrobacter ilicis]NIJ03288.1 cell division protein FtsW [Paenarthrobacter ilicis]
MVSTPTRTLGKAPRGGKPGASKAGEKKPSGLRRHWRRFWESLEGKDKAPNSSTYYLILGCSLALTAIGIMMVLSASSVEAIAAGKSPYADALKQAVFGLMGAAAMYVISRTNVNWMKRLSWWAFGVVVVLLALVQVMGNSVNGNKNWVDIGGVTLQPSEMAKLVLCVWIAAVLARKQKLLHSWKHVIIPVVPGAGLVIGLVMLGNDLGTVIVIAAIAAAGLYFAGVPGKMLAIAGTIATVGAVAATVSSANRICRITSWLGNPSAQCTEQFDFDFQSTNGMYGLAQGSWTGLGLGQSRQKYNWLPEAHNDFIFAIIGEELGLVGTIVVLALFAILGIAIFRVVVRQTDPFQRTLAGGIMVWLLGQASMNMAVVTQLLPVVGVPLPFISYGGSALVMSLCGVGVVLSLARGQLPPQQRPGFLPRRSPKPARKRT